MIAWRRYIKFGLTPVSIILICLVGLNALSLAAVYSSLHETGTFTKQGLFYKEIVWTIIAWVFLLVFSFINYRIYFDIAYLLYAFTIILLIAVEVFGRAALGATRWLSIGGFSFQPSELAKISIIFLLARMFASQDRSKPLANFFLPLACVVGSALIIAKQPDLGTALIVVFLFFLMAVSAPIRKRYLVAIISLAAVAAPFAYHHLKDYQKKRIIVFVNPNVDPLGAGYTIIQSKIAIGSGRFLGKGFLGGTQNQFNFLPERHTDFIFTVIAEEGGFVGSLFLLMLFWIMINQIHSRAGQLKDPFAQYVCLGISSLFFLHVCINIGMTLGILPVVGVPLLFMSYGGTHLLIAFSLVGIFFNIHRHD